MSDPRKVAVVGVTGYTGFRAGPPVAAASAN